jgi:secreted trypsin-like serine protease
MKAIFVCFLIVLIGQKKTSCRGKIIGGKEIEIDKAPYQVYLLKTSGLANETSFCGGSLLSKEFVLTAAHCTFSLRKENLIVRAGSNDYKSGGVVIGVEEIIDHPLYDRNILDYDFSILRISQTPKLPKQVGFIKLPSERDDLKAGDVVFISGWGANFDPTADVRRLRGVKMPIVNTLQCKMYYDAMQGEYVFTDRMFCAGSDSKFKSKKLLKYI